MQWLLDQADRDADEVRGFVLEHSGAEYGVPAVDETGFIKKGIRSAGNGARGLREYVWALVPLPGEDNDGFDEALLIRRSLADIERVCYLVHAPVNAPRAEIVRAVHGGERLRRHRLAGLRHRPPREPSRLGRTPPVACGGQEPIPAGAVRRPGTASTVTSPLVISATTSRTFSHSKCDRSIRRSRSFRSGWRFLSPSLEAVEAPLDGVALLVCLPVEGRRPATGLSAPHPVGLLEGRSGHAPGVVPRGGRPGLRHSTGGAPGCWRPESAGSGHGGRMPW